MAEPEEISMETAKQLNNYLCSKLLCQGQRSYSESEEAD